MLPEGGVACKGQRLSDSSCLTNNAFYSQSPSPFLRIDNATVVEHQLCLQSPSKSPMLAIADVAIQCPLGQEFHRGDRSRRFALHAHPIHRSSLSWQRPLMDQQRVAKPMESLFLLLLLRLD